jgi:hypothetical protein
MFNIFLKGQRTITEMLSYPLDKKTRCPNKFSSEIVSGTAPVLSPINATSDCGNFNGYSKKADILLNGKLLKKKKIKYWRDLLSLNNLICSRFSCEEQS